MMSQRHLLTWIAMFVAGGLALLGGAVFVVGLIIEIMSTRQSSTATVSQSMVIGLSGLCLATAMFIIWFVLIGILILRQNKEQGSGYGNAYRLIERFRFDEAIPLLEKSIQDGKETSDVLMLLTSAYAYTGQLAKAQSTADRAVQLFPDSAGAYITLANGYRLQAAYDEAAFALEEALKYTPEEGTVWAELGFIRLFAGNKSSAIEAFEQAIRYPLSAMYRVRVYYHLAEHYKKMGDMQQMIRAQAILITSKDGLFVWENGLVTLRGTAYGQVLHYELQSIENAIKEIK